jgi:hypothetical protein
LTLAAQGRASLLSRPQLELAELLDRTLGAGVVVAGDLTLSVADVELVYVNLRALVASVATLEAQGIPFPANGGTGVERGPGRLGEGRPSPSRGTEHADSPADTHPGSGRTAVAPLTTKAARSAQVDQSRDDERLQRGLAQLVLTVVELLRKLMEKQALRRVEGGTLEPERVERLGRAFERLELEMAELKKRFELDDDDLTLRLGSLPIFEKDDQR